MTDIEFQKYQQDNIYRAYLTGLAGQPLTEKPPISELLAYVLGKQQQGGPRPLAEVIDAVKALHDPNFPTLQQQWQERSDRLQAERDELRGKLDAMQGKTVDVPVQRVVVSVGTVDTVVTLEPYEEHLSRVIHEIVRDVVNFSRVSAKLSSCQH